MECIKDDIAYLIKNIEKNVSKVMGREEKIKYYDTILESIETAFTSDDYDISGIDKGKDEIIEIDIMKVTFTTTQNQRNNQNNNMTSIDLGECEILLRNFYNISKDMKLYMKKIDIEQEGMKIPKTEFDVYCKLSGSNLKKLDLSICKDSNIALSIPVSISENLEQLDSHSKYYNDICYSTTSDTGTYIPLNDRKKEFVENNKTLCQDGCELFGYDYSNKRANCSCKVKKSSSSIADININKTKLYENFFNVKNIANFNLLVCYKNLFNKKGILSNIGSYIIMIIILFHIICILIFYLKQLRALKKKIKNIIFAIKNFKLLKQKKSWKKNKLTTTNNLKEIENENEDEDNKNKISLLKKKNIKKRNKNIFDNNKINNNKNLKKKASYIEINQEVINNNSYDTNKNKKNNKGRNKSFEFKGGRNNIKKIKSLKSKEKRKIKKIEKILKYKDDEINILPYELALLYDKRTYFKYYFSLLKTQHNLLFSFFNSDDYNSKIIKIDLFFIGFTIYYTVNALFYNDEAMHKIYESEGSFDFIYQLPKEIYSSIISLVLNTLLKILALSNSSIIALKQDKSKENVKKRGKILKNKLNVKFILYFIISFICLLFFWYYLAMFGAIYRNTQYHLLKDTLISFGLSLIYPFIIYLIPGFFRIPALKNPKKKRKILYNFSKIIQMF